jgi:hypothetical protein
VLAAIFIARYDDVGKCFAMRVTGSAAGGCHYLTVKMAANTEAVSAYRHHMEPNSIFVPVRLLETRLTNAIS